MPASTTGAVLHEVVMLRWPGLFIFLPVTLASERDSEPGPVQRGRRAKLRVPGNSQATILGSKGKSCACSLGAFAFLGAVLLPPLAWAQVLRDNLWVTNGPVNTVAVSGNVIYLGGEFTQVGPVTGGGIAFDAGTGAAIQPYSMVAGSVLAVASDNSGGWYIGGNFTAVLGQPRSNLAHLDASGNLTSWDPNANGSVFALAMSGGTVYVGGQFTGINGASRKCIAALDGATGIPTGWNPGANAEVLALGLSIGRVYVGGAFTSIDGQPRNYIAAFDASTGAILDWNPNATFWVLALAVTELDHYPFTINVYAGGWFASIGGQPRSFIAVLDGVSGDATNWTTTANNVVRALAVNNVGTIYAGGEFTSIGGHARSHIAALDGVSGDATNWDPNANGTIRALARSAGTVYAGGTFTSIGGQTRNNLAELDARESPPPQKDPYFPVT